jgi:radical SAM superfamily enzyme YgiQ (UPF0313 family)
VSFVIAPTFNRAMPHHGIGYLRSSLEAVGCRTDYHDLSALCHDDPFLQPCLAALITGPPSGRTLYSSLDPFFEGFFGTGLEARMGKIWWQIYDDWLSKSANSILESDPDIVALSVYDTNLVTSLGIAERLKAAAPQVVTVAGGPFLADPTMISILAELSTLIDYIVVGEGEQPLVALVGCLSGTGEDLPETCVRTRSGAPSRLPETKLVEDLDVLPPPLYRGAPFAAYRRNIRRQVSPITGVGCSGEIVLPVSFGRGCPFRCSFCGHNACWSTYRVRSVEKVVDELRALRDQYRCRVFRVNDSLVNMNRGWLIKLCETLIASRLDIFWYGHARAATIDRELAEKMYQAGCRYLKLGIESGSDRVLDLMNKRATSDQMARGLAAIHAAGIRTRASFILGFPGEAEADLRQTLAFISSIQEQIDAVRVFENLLLPASDVANHPERFGVELQTFDLPQLANRTVTELVRTLPRSWACSQTAVDRERRAELVEELRPLMAGDRHRLLPPVFPKLLADALMHDPVVEINNQRGRSCASGEEASFLDGLEPSGKRLSQVAKDLGISSDQARAQATDLMAMGLLQVQDPP